jgi:poly(3-hydroxybutyrate) depolymerase
MARQGLLALFLVLSLSQTNGQQQLQRYNIDRSKTTVSGISSGGVMATQYHFAHSSQVHGAGVFATVPYMCGFGGVSAATLCMTTPNLVNVPFLISEANALANQGYIENPSNVAGDPVYIYHGSRDSVVLPGSGPNVREVYQHFGARIVTKFDIASDHAQPTNNYGSACGSSAEDTAWISNCNYQGAYEMLNHLYGGSLQRPDGNTVANGDFILFSQAEFFNFAPSLSSMDTAGYVYIPTDCRDKTTPCALHIAFHGCVQNRAAVGDVYARRAGYLEVAELNNIVVLFPQTIASTLLGNPNGCWDWWGYLNNLYSAKEGNQVLATYRMMNRIING